MILKPARFAASALLLTLLPAARAMAPPDIAIQQALSKNDPYRQCGGTDSAAAIIGCTIIIDARDTTPRVRSSALANRGSAYLNRSDPERAITDLNRALMIDSANST